MSRSARAAAGAAVVNVTQRLRARRRAARFHSVRVALLVLTAVALVVGTGWVAANSSLVEVREVTVDGTSRLSVGEVLAAAHVSRGESLVRLDPTAVADRVERLAPVASASVHRDWPHRVVIDVVERRPVAVVADADGATLVDRTGVAFAHVTQVPRGLVPLRLGGPVGGGGGAAEARAAVVVLGSLPTGLRRDVEMVRAPSPDEVSFDLADGRHVVWGSAEDGQRKAAVLRVLLRRPARVVDVSTPEVAVTR